MSRQKTKNRIITPRAVAVLKNHPYMKTIQADYIDVVDFGNKAHLLHGPFDEKYGIVTVTDCTKTAKRSIEQVLEDYRQSALDTCAYMPYATTKKVEKLFGHPTSNEGSDVVHYYSEFWWNDKTKTAISDIDIAAGHSAKGFVNDSRCAVFFRTKEGFAKVRASLTDEEYSEWVSAIDSRIEQNRNHIEQVTPTRDKPFIVGVFGDDDTSFGLVFSTMDEAKESIRRMKQDGMDYVKSNFEFTN